MGHSETGDAGQHSGFGEIQITDVNMNRALAFFMLLLSFGLGTADLAFHYAALPDTVASHFDASGQPDDWMSKSGFLAVYFALLGLLAVLFIGLPLLIRRLPDSMINVPHKKYWLAPERRSTTLDWFARQLYWFGMLFMLFVISLTHQLLRFNLGKSAGLEKSFWFLLIAYLLITILWSINLILKFRNAPTHARLND